MNEDEMIKSSVGVVGAGIQGVCISLFLVKKGFEVTLIDRDEPGKDSASYGNAGHLSPRRSFITTNEILVKQPMIVFFISNILIFSFLNVVSLCLNNIYV